MLRLNLARVAALLGVLVLWAALPLTAAAHAQLVRSNPSPGAVLPAAPEVIQLWFSEPLERDFSEVVIYDNRRQRVDTGSAIAPGDPVSMIVRLGPVGPGAYVVAWKTLSTVDGHTARGSFTFAFGPPDQVGAFSAEVGVEQQPLDPLGVGARWLTYVGLALALGSLAFGPLVWAPALRRADEGAGGGLDRIDDVVRRRLRLLFWIGLGVALFGQIEWLIYQVNAVGGAGADPNAAAIKVLTGTRFGLFLLVRTGFLLLIALAVAFGWTGMALTIGAGALLTLPLSGHAAASPFLPEVAILMDFLHLAATAAWAGGLPVLAVVLWEVLRHGDPARRNRIVGGLATRFSTVGLVSLGALVVTGAWASWTHVGAPEALVQSRYGQALIAKTALVALVAGLAAINLLIIRPRLAAAAQRSTGKNRKASTAAGGGARAWFPRVVALEAGVGIVILAVAGVLTIWTPAIQDPTVILGDPMRQRAAVEELDVELTVRPNRATENEIALSVRDLRRQPARDIVRAKVDLTMLDHEMGTVEVPLQPAGDGQFATRTPAIAMIGNWQADAVLYRSNGEELRTSFRFQVPEGPPPQVVRPVFAFPGFTTGIVVALEALVGAVVLAGAARYLGRRRPGVGRALLAPAVVALLLGAGLFVRESVSTPQANAAALQNPFPDDPASVARGLATYEQHCLACHGVNGRGDGPLAQGLRPRPADLREHLTAHTEAELYTFIARGVAGTAMPAWENTLAAEERWDVLNYIRAAFGEASR